MSRRGKGTRGFSFKDQIDQQQQQQYSEEDDFIPFTGIVVKGRKKKKDKGMSQSSFMGERGREGNHFKQNDKTPPHKKLRGSPSNGAQRGGRGGSPYPKVPSPNSSSRPNSSQKKNKTSPKPLYFGFVYKDETDSSEESNESEEKSLKEEEIPDELLFFEDRFGEKESVTKSIQKTMRSIEEVPHIFNRLKLNINPNLSEYEAEDENTKGQEKFTRRLGYDVEESSNNEEEISEDMDEEMMDIVQRYDLDNYDMDEENPMYIYTSAFRPNQRKVSSGKNNRGKVVKRQEHIKRQAEKKSQYDDVLQDFMENMLESPIESEGEGQSSPAVQKKDSPSTFKIYQNHETNMAPTDSKRTYMKGFNLKEGSKQNKKPIETKGAIQWMSGGKMTKEEEDVTENLSIRISEKISTTVTLTPSSGQLAVDLVRDDPKKSFTESPALLLTRKEKRKQRRLETKRLKEPLNDEMMDVDDEEEEEMFVFNSKEESDEESENELEEEEEEIDDDLLESLDEEGLFAHLDKKERLIFAQQRKIQQAARELKRAAKEVKKKKSLETMLDQNQIRRFLKDLDVFMTDYERDTWEMPPMPNSTQRKQIHFICQTFELITYSTGKGGHRAITIGKSPNGMKALNKSQLNGLVQRVTSLQFINDYSHKSKNKDDKRKKKSQKKKDKRQMKDPSSFMGDGGNGGVRPAVGSEVGEEASPISDANLGKKLLLMMGWSGGGLGSQGQGIVNPVGAIVRQKNSGLGYS